MEYASVARLYAHPCSPSDALRPNALLLQGVPISFLPTALILSYAKHYDAEPLKLEWVDDVTCVLVFASDSDCKTAHRLLLKSAVEERDAEGCLTAKSIPVTLWPEGEAREDRLRGVIRMRMARSGDRKRAGAREESEFYKKHGRTAGKEDEGGDFPRKRRRRGEDDDAEARRAALDAELDDFLADGEDAEEDGSSRKRTRTSTNGHANRSPPSKMRADYVDPVGRSLLERTSLMRAHVDDIDLEYGHDPERPRRREYDGEARPMRPLPRRRGRRDEGGREAERPVRTERPRKTQQELDAELDAFLNERD